METSHGKRKRRWANVGRWAVLALMIAGCSAGGGGISRTCTTDSDGNTSCKITIVQQQDAASPTDVTSGGSGSSVAAYRLILNLPSDVALNISSPVQATLGATTDKGYTSSITVTMQPTTSTTQPVAPGDTVYTFLLPNTSEVTNWASAVVANATSSINVTSSIVSGMNLLGNPGTFTVTVQQITEQTGPTTVGSIGVTDPGSSTGCPPCPPGKPCTVCGPQN